MWFKKRFPLFLAVILWASAFAGIRAGLEGYSPGGLALLRFAVASVCMFGVYVCLPKRNLISLRDKTLLLLTGVLGVASYNIALNYGELSVPSGTASFIISQSPIITAIFGILFLREKFNKYIFLGMFVSILGVALITSDSLRQFNFSLGILYVLLATTVGGFYSILQKPFLKKYHALEVTAYIIWGATLSLLIYMPDALHDVVRASVQSTASAIYLGIFPAALGYVAWSYGLKEIPASTAVSFLYFMPVIAIFVGWIWLGETPPMLSLIGGVVALLGVYIVNSNVRPSSVMQK